MDEMRTVLMTWDKAAGTFSRKHCLYLYRTETEGNALIAFDAKTLKYVVVNDADDYADRQRFALYEPEVDPERIRRTYGAYMQGFVDELNADKTHVPLQDVIPMVIQITVPAKIVEEMLASGELDWLN